LRLSVKHALLDVKYRVGVGRVVNADGGTGHRDGREREKKKKRAHSVVKNTNVNRQRFMYSNTA
jgi:hypothetical protein